MASIGSCIVLNDSYAFLSINEWFDAFTLVCNGRAKVLHHYDGQLIRSAYTAVPAPAVIQLNHHVRLRDNRRQPFTLPSHKNIWVRDKGRCAYCNTKVGLKTVTKDHVIPRCRGGADSLKNVVAACTGCNSLKADKSAGEVGLKLRPDIELRELTNDEKLTVLMKTCQSIERKTWTSFMDREKLTLF